MKMSFAGICYGKFHQTELNFASVNLPQDKKVFLICIHGESAAFQSMEILLESKHTNLIGKFPCKRYDTFGEKNLVKRNNDFEMATGNMNGVNGRICSWELPLAEAYGVRLPSDYDGEVPPQMQIMDVPEGECIVFEHGAFDFETENQAVEAKIEKAMREFNYSESGYELDTVQGRVFYFYHDCKRFWKYARPVKRIK